MIKTMRHAAIVVTDMDKALRFYRDLLGLKVVLDKQQEGEFFENLLALEALSMRVVMLESPDGGRLELFQFHSHPKAAPSSVQANEIGCAHVAFSVSDIDKTYQILLQEGIEFNCPPLVSPDGYGKVTYCHDADGTIIELVQILGKGRSPYQSNG